MSSDLDNFIPPADYLEAIGMVAVRWAYLEFAVQMTIAFVGQLDPIKTFAITKASAIDSWLDAIESIITLDPHYQGALTPFQAQRKRIKKLHAKRNGIVHGAWALDVEDTREWQTLGIPKRGTNIFSVQTFSIDEMNDVAEKIKQESEALYRICRPKTSPPKSP